MRRKLPSLNQLRVFEAAARHESFKAAAEELCVTQAAVSHQVKALEAALGVRLFLRGVRKVELTEDARAFAHRLTGCLDAIAEAAEGISARGRGGTLRLSVAPFFGNRWLLPRLGALRAARPGLDVQPVLSFDHVDLAAEGFDAALRYGLGDWPGTVSELVFRDVVGPVCTPHLVAGRAGPLPPEEIARLPLATARSWASDWGHWFRAAGLDPVPPLDETEYESRAFAFDCALSGNGVCLADSRLTGPDEAAGNLVRLSPVKLECAQGIHLVRPAAKPAHPGFETSLAWRREEAARGAAPGGSP